MHETILEPVAIPIRLSSEPITQMTSDRVLEVLALPESIYSFGNTRDGFELKHSKRS
jgi:hypothetical protein